MDLKRLQLKPHKLFHHLDRVTAWKNSEYFPPVFVEFSPTDRCNQKCWFCYTEYLGNRKLEIPPTDLVRMFRQMGEAGVRSVMIQGTGEPLMNSGTPDAVVQGHGAGLSLALCSNGVLLNEPVLEKMLPHLEWMRISSIECTPELYARSHGTSENQWHRVMGNLKTAVAVRDAQKLPVVIAAHMLLFPYNVEKVLETVQMVKDLGLDYILIKSANQSIHNPSHQWPRDTHRKYGQLLHEAKALEEDDFLVSVRFDQFEVQESEGAFAKNFSQCHGIEFETMVDADGGVYPCLHFWRNPDYSFGNLYEKTFEEIWRGERRSRVMEKIYHEFDLDLCRFGCKAMHINETLWELANPPMHMNFL